MKRSYPSGAKKRQKAKKGKTIIDQLPKVSSFFKVSTSQSGNSESHVASTSLLGPNQLNPCPDYQDEDIDSSASAIFGTIPNESKQVLTDSGITLYNVSSGLKSAVTVEHSKCEILSSPPNQVCGGGQSSPQIIPPDGKTFFQKNDYQNQQESEELPSLDAAMWGKCSKAKLQEHFTIKGPSCCQNLNAGFNQSARVYEKKGKPPETRKCKAKFFYRQLKNGDRVKRDWLLYSPTNGRVYCFVCKLFDSSMSSNPFCLDGFNDWKHAADRIAVHENSKEHRKCLLTFLTRSSEVGRIDTNLQIQMNNERVYWRKVLTRIVSVVRFLTERGLPLRGDNENFGSPNNGNYLGLLELLSEYDPFLKEHINKYGGAGSGKTSYLSHSICDEFIEVIGKQVFEEVIKEVKASKYYSLSVDSTPDVAHIDQLTFVIRYVKSGVPTERFLKFIPISGHTAENLFHEVIGLLNENNIPISDCRGQSYDNASNMSGRYNGLQAKVKELNELAEFVPCSSHSLNLVGVSVAECNSEGARYFHFVQSLYVFFSSSTSRWRMLVVSLKGKKKVLKALSSTRWSARADAVVALKENYTNIKSTLQAITKNREQSADTKIQASGLIKSMERFDTVFLTHLWNDILARINKVNKILQKPTLTLATSVTLLNSLMNFIIKKRDSFDRYVTTAETVMGYKFEDCKKKRAIKRSSNIVFFDNSTEPESVHTGKDRLKIEVFLPIIDALTVNLRERSTKYDLVAKRFGFLEDLINLKEADLQAACNALSEIYKDDINGNELFEECLHLQSFLEEDKELEKLMLKTVYEDDSEEDDDGSGSAPEMFDHQEDDLGRERDNDEDEFNVPVPVSSSHKLNLKTTYKHLQENELFTVFPNVEISLRIFLCIMISNASAERSFSKLKLVKGYLRSTMKQDRLNYLSILSIENDILRRLDFEDIINDFAIKKCRKKTF